MKSAGFPQGTPAPRSFEKQVAAAYLRMLGATQKAAGAAVGRSERTLQAWEADTVTWERARAEARRRWLGALTDVARKTVLETIRAGDGDLAMKVLERVDGDLAPPHPTPATSARDWPRPQQSVAGRRGRGCRP
jgi:hypothetical protein